MTGVREDFAQTYFKSMTTGAVSNENDAAFTWRTGLVYLFQNGLAPYASYSTSFQPDVGTTASGAAFKPTTGQQYEAGVKYQPPGSNSFVTASAFHILEQNVATTDPSNPLFEVQTGEVRSQGVTLEGHYEATTDLKLIGTYTYTDLKNTESNQYLGKVPVGIPENMASAWADYRFPWSWTRALDVGVGVRYLGASWGDAANDFQVPAVTLFDAAVHFDMGKLSPRFKGATFSVSATNVFDKVYISSCIATTFCTFGDGRTVLANLKYNW
jgi:iron complex outermembrane receptor protein